MADVNQKIKEEAYQDAPPICLFINHYTLTANTAENIVVPSGAHFVLFSCDQPKFYYRTTGTAEVPSSDVTDGTGSALNPTFRSCDAGDTISVISPTAGVLTVEYYNRY